MKEIKIAIDPGWSGSLAVNYTGDLTEAYKCPDTQKEIIDLVQEMKELSLSDGHPISAVIEKVHAMPGNGVTSTWKFASNYATWQAALLAFKIPYEEIRPNDWMKKLGGVPSGKDKKKERKNYIKDKMQKKYPDLKVTLINADALAMLSVCYDKT
jgi:hypothetical protein